jgi:hypothetical protein
MIRSMATGLLAVALVLGPSGASHAQRAGGHAGSGGHVAGGDHFTGGGGRFGGGGHFDGHRGHFGGRTGVFVDVGPWWWGPPWYYAPPYYASPYYAYPPQVVVEEPPEYIEQRPSTYWYYCRRSHAYYPDVETCPEEWIKVPPPP